MALSATATYIDMLAGTPPEFKELDIQAQIISKRDSTSQLTFPTIYTIPNISKVQPHRYPLQLCPRVIMNSKFTLEYIETSTDPCYLVTEAVIVHAKLRAPGPKEKRTRSCLGQH